ncbi:type II toxin-antitoxin system VapC family toxin [Algiphilus sp. W345]|uniref:Type II toxin-antitoxin system VapC family toxin n=1 Tax=Banduia mediterranea TaxID=3075609 RepID=A0ABU2WEJ7_9GAMM|nr:type II toxin-antitoxin system VapC family toxin [Algiphilus sp. W345]MDT0496295.1 type II toxin-antitoxin system VapC family toxin [Algiphilus sp. W345]
MIFDTDVLIWFLRGSPKAARAVDSEENRSISLVTYMELLQRSKNKHETHEIKGFLKDFGFSTLPLTENIGHRASIYVEEYALSHSIGVAGALVAATAVEGNQVLLSANIKHFKCVKELQLKQFRP